MPACLRSLSRPDSGSLHPVWTADKRSRRRSSLTCLIASCIHGFYQLWCWRDCGVLQNTSTQSTTRKKISLYNPFKAIYWSSDVVMTQFTNLDINQSTVPIHSITKKWFLRKIARHDMAWHRAIYDNAEKILYIVTQLGRQVMQNASNINPCQ